ncbi:RidA family protein [Flavobacterium sp.]|uniref:RidA family protein n=2 Tax=Flavobacterium sp. TaxID=239 RepID=UPI003753BCE6
MSNRKFITTGVNIPKTSAPISQAVVAGNYCHISGQISVDSEGKFIDGTIEEQTELAFNNLLAVLKKTGFSINEIVFIDIAFTNLKDLEFVNPYFDSLFEVARKPARTIYQAAALPAGAKIKVMAIAIKDNI